MQTIDRDDRNDRDDRDDRDDEDRAPRADGARALAADEVRLSGGRIARVRRTNSLHDHRSDMLVVAAGFDKGGVPNAAVHTRFRALLAVATIDGRPLRWPRGRKADMEVFLERFDSGDCEVVAIMYERLNENLTPHRVGHTGAAEGTAMTGAGG